MGKIETTHEKEIAEQNEDWFIAWIIDIRNPPIFVTNFSYKQAVT